MRRAAVVVCVLAGCAAPRAPLPNVATAANSAAAPPTIVTSNILRRDYAGSQACAACHADVYEKFMAAPMHNMTRLPTATTPMPSFAGTFKFKDDAVRFETSGDDRLMHIDAQGQPPRTFKVTRVIGGHYREDFAGVEIGGRDSKSERILPASYFLATNTWRYKGYSVLGPERPGLRPGGIWNKTCIFCHNTIPYFDDILGAISDPRLGPYQGEVVDPLLPAARRATWEVTDTTALARAVADEIGVLGARPQAANASAGALLQAVRARFGAGQLVELGIGCESCHGGSVEHVKHNATKPAFAPRAAFLRVSVPGKDERVSGINRACARCHQVLFTQYPWTWEGERRKGAAPGGSNINSGEARDFLLGGCTSALACSDCHDPHAHNKPRNAELETRADAVCVRCHRQLETTAQQQAHTHHDPAGAGGRCLNCHMPRKNLSLDNRLTRYHRIASPTENAKVLGDRPLECALCHGDKSVETLVTTMETWWHKRYDRTPLRALYGDDLAHADPLVTTLTRGKPHEQALALALLGARGTKAPAALMAAQLTHTTPIVRYYAQSALEAALGTKPPDGFDVHANDDAIVAAAGAWLRAAGVKASLRAPIAPAANANAGDGDTTSDP